MFPSRLLLALLALPALLAIGVVFDRALLKPVLVLDGALFIARTPSGHADAQRSGARRTSSPAAAEPESPELVPRHPRRCARVNEDLFGRHLPDLSVRELPARGGQVTYRVVPKRRGAFELGDHSRPLPVEAPPVTLAGTARPTPRASTGSGDDPNLRALARTNWSIARPRHRCGAARRSSPGCALPRTTTTAASTEGLRAPSNSRREYQLESDQNVFFMLDGRLMTAVSTSCPSSITR